MKNIAKERLVKHIRKLLEAEDKKKAIAELNEMIHDLEACPRLIDILGEKSVQDYKKEFKELETLARQVKTQLLLEMK